MVFMDGLKVGPSRTQLFRCENHHASTAAVQGALGPGPNTGPVLMELGTAVQSSIRCYVCGMLGHMKRACPERAKEAPFQTQGLERSVATTATQASGVMGSPVGEGRPTGEDLSPHGRSADGAHNGGLAPESVGALKARKSSGGLLVLYASVRGYGDPFRI
ncbi:Gag protein [Phytophthora palmivora]|uniref:Gag protein n=1 Tax=Phytophthora palmivora TaxID=4796 RepID=A0A2P4YJC4_9STRA|nr:Gag protein [Phytophthora palmivora]